MLKHLMLHLEIKPCLHHWIELTINYCVRLET